MNSPTSSAERRRFQRFNFEGTVRLYSGSAMWETKLVDVSLKGVLIERPVEWQGKLGGGHRLDLRINGSVIISMGVSIAHVMPHRLGCRWEKIDLDSFSQLKRLIELNLGDPSLLNRELSALG
ncbi:PilZ domain-containing protein [Tahibacter amnicola]|uniref:Cyclic diguanosine monophosphate-binding protein n=1 Tax=Tahibacter amnicola TaxID=2976241 RepID=A0ABY6BJP1_9GAMM|nr:PilZ domain-containing protein [Tahibacter amnicola]UXI69598.1 PilZ domain-containing protein [Tahibacter amnicola]